MKTTSQITFNEYRATAGEHGGPRSGAGRPAGERPLVHHVKRPDLSEEVPAHVTMRVLEDVPSLRTKRFMRIFRRSLRQVRGREDFRVAQYSVQGDHVHLIVEASGRDALARGMTAVGSRLARAANRVFGRSGRIPGRPHGARAELREPLGHV